MEEAGQSPEVVGQRESYQGRVEVKRSKAVSHAVGGLSKENAGVCHRLPSWQPIAAETPISSMKAARLQSWEANGILRDAIPHEFSADGMRAILEVKRAGFH